MLSSGSATFMRSARKMIISSIGKYKTIQVGCICNDVGKDKYSVSGSLTFMSSARKMVISCRGK
jgi:hypothetical protein